jgi:hypothetical protein
MKPQNFANHARFVVGYHGVFVVLLLAILGGSVVNLIKSWGDHERIYSASLILALTIAAFMITFFARIFALKAQDRAIRAEENLRHFVLTGKLLDPRSTSGRSSACALRPMRSSSNWQNGRSRRTSPRPTSRSP